MTKTKKPGTKISLILFWVVAIILPFAIFMFFMSPIKWTDQYLIEYDAALPSFFELMFGGEATKYFGDIAPRWAINPGMVIIFVLQIAIIICSIIAVILFANKKQKGSFLTIAVVGVLAVVAGILSLCSSKFDISITANGVSGSLKEIIANGAGAFVYGFVMLFGGIAAFLPYGIKYCLKK